MSVKPSGSLLPRALAARVDRMEAIDASLLRPNRLPAIQAIEAEMARLRVERLDGANVVRDRQSGRLVSPDALTRLAEKRQAALVAARDGLLAERARLKAEALDILGKIGLSSPVGADDEDRIFAIGYLARGVINAEAAALAKAALSMKGRR